MSAVLTVASPRRVRPFLRLLVGGYLIATLDMLVAMVYWVPQGVPAQRAWQSIAAWFLGDQAYAGGLATAVLGAILYGHLMWGVVVLYRALDRRWSLLRRQPWVCGAVYGLIMFFVIFHGLVPLLTDVDSGWASGMWLTICLLSFICVVGIPCAWLAREDATA